MHGAVPEQRRRGICHRLPIEIEAVDVEVPVLRRRPAIEVIDEADSYVVRSGAEIAVEGKRLRSAGAMERGHGERRAVELMPVDRNGEFRVAFIRVLRKVKNKLVGTGSEGAT
jgi:hypothetical protein